MLGYRDSGMAGSEANANPDCFAAAPLDEATERLVAVIRRTRPQVMVIYGDDQSGYPHPDHLRVHDAGLAAFRAAGDPTRFPRPGRPYQPAKLYYTIHSAARFRAIHEKFEELGLESPFDEEWRERWDRMPDEVPTTLHRHHRLHRRAAPRPTGPRHPGRSHVEVLVRTAARGDGHHPAPRRLPAGPGRCTRRDGHRARIRRYRRDRPVRRGSGGGDRVTAQWLSGEWLAEVAVEVDGISGPPTLTGSVVVDVTGGPGGDASIHAVFADGHLVGSGAGSLPSPDVTLTVTDADARAIVAGELDPSVAFMQGRMKVVGAMGPVIDLLALAATDEVRARRARIAELDGR